MYSTCIVQMAELKSPDLSFAAVQKQRLERGFGAVLTRGLPAARNRANGAARVPVDHGRPLGARACPPGTRGSTLSLGLKPTLASCRATRDVHRDDHMQ